MSAYVEECRKEWRRLGVPTLLAEEMATELESDLAEAEADGVSAAEMLGESDPRRFATTWAVERGLIEEPRPPRSHKWAWITASLVLLLLLLFIFPAFAVFGVASGGSETAQVSPARRVGPIRVPKLVGLPICQAVVKAENVGLDVHAPSGTCSAIVIKQRPHAGRTVAGISAKTDFVKLWTRRPGG